MPIDLFFPTLLQMVQKIEGTDKELRKKQIIESLKDWEIPFELQRYDSGENIVAQIGEAPFVGIGSHYDVVPNSPGANDNASAIVITLRTLIELNILREGKYSLGIGVKGFFFDEEEKGLIGSTAYVKQNGVDDLIGFYNMELVGAGDKFVLWDVPEKKESLLLKSFEQSAKKEKISVERLEKMVVNSADHRSFTQAGLSDAFTITTVTQEDLDIIPVYLKAVEENNIAKIMNIVGKAPVFKHYHQPTDISEHLDNDSLLSISMLLSNSLFSIDNKYK